MQKPQKLTYQNDTLGIEGLRHQFLKVMTSSAYLISRNSTGSTHLPIRSFSSCTSEERLVNVFANKPELRSQRSQ